VKKSMKIRRKTSPFLFLAFFCACPVIAQSEVNTGASLPNAALAVASGGDPKQMAQAAATGSAYDFVRSTVAKWLPNTEFSLSGFERGKPSFGILTVQPLKESEDLRNTTFGQASIFNNDGRQTLNFGVGHRWLTEDKKWLIGANLFYDHEFPYDHQRASMGLEVRSSILEVNTNKYQGISKWKSVNNNNEERALSGYDIEFGVVLPYLPGSKIYHKVFKWSAYDDVRDLKGSTTSLAVAGDIFVPGLTAEIGLTKYDDQRDRQFAQLTYRYPSNNKDSKPLFSKEAYKFHSMEEQRLNKVRRENMIIKQSRSSSGGLSVSFR